MKELIDIQSKLKAPKDLRNNFAHFNYRSAESILEAVKPLLKENKCTLTITDDIVMVGNRIYVKATAVLRNDKGDNESVTAFAREAESVKGMDPSQVTGSTSSYARKYALNGLFCIDDNKDADSRDNRQEAPQSNAEAQKKEPVVIDPTNAKSVALGRIAIAKTFADLKAIFEGFPSLQSDREFLSALSSKKKEVKP